MTDRKDRESGPIMRGIGAGIIAFAIAFALGAASPPVRAQAAVAQGFDEAHLLRSLDIMLMVTSLRCRTGMHDFQADYDSFATAHLSTMSAAGEALRSGLAASYGERDAGRALDRMGVRIANSYGDGHPWMDCAELRRATRELARSSDRVQLVAAARTLLGAEPPEAQWRFAGQTSPDEQPVPGVQAGGARVGYDMVAQWEPGRP